ncbi:MAG: TIGR02530 family flagellar biosynthesis protein [Bacillota bacterium]
MNDKFFIQQPIRPIAQPLEKNKQGTQQSQNQTSFRELLDKQINKGEELKFSKHAQQRMSIRNIELNKEELDKLNDAVEKAAHKGAKESLILMDDFAFVVSIKNKTVITAVDGANIKENVFTNIDSAVII